MDFITPTDIDLSLKELITLCDDSVPLMVTPEVLAIALAAGDMTPYSPDMQTAVTALIAVMAKAIAHATTVINAHVGERYPLPFTAVPELIKTIAGDIAVWRLFYRKNKNKLPEAVQAAYDNSMKILGQVRDGKLGIGVVPLGDSPVPLIGDALTVSAGTALFTADVLDRY